MDLRTKSIPGSVAHTRRPYLVSAPPHGGGGGLYVKLKTIKECFRARQLSGHQYQMCSQACQRCVPKTIPRSTEIDQNISTEESVESQ